MDSVSGVAMRELLVHMYVFVEKRIQMHTMSYGNEHIIVYLKVLCSPVKNNSPSKHIKKRFGNFTN